MQVKFSHVDEELPYKSEYIGFQTPPIAPVLNIGGSTGHNVRTYSELVKTALKDLTNYNEPIQLLFDDNLILSDEAKGLTKLLFGALQKSNHLEDIISNLDTILKSRFDVKYDQS